MRWPLVIAAVLRDLLAIASPAGLPSGTGAAIPAETSPPFTYCIWYLPDPDKSSFLADLKKSPPDLFHLGYHIPFKGALGPTYGHDLYTNDILPPDRIAEEVERIRSIMQKMRDAGVGMLIPYVYSMAFFGNADERTGFFRFYDQWDAYREFGLGPKPVADPSLWSQQRGPEPLGGGPPNVFHYNPCVNQPPWREYMDLVVRQLAGVGYDGMFADVNTQYCYCPHCQELFDVYLLRKYGRAGLREVFGTDDFRRLNLSTIYPDFEAAILPGFRQYLEKSVAKDELTRFLGTASADGLKLDEDWRLLRCYMQGSLGEYPPRDNIRAYLRTRFGAERAEAVLERRRDEFVQTVLRWYFRQYLESTDLKGVLQDRFGSSDIMRRCCGSPRDLLLWVETQRFWCDSMAGLLARIKQVGSDVVAEQGRRQGFYTVANLGSMATVDGLNKRRVDGIDLVRWARAADLQMFEEMQQPGSLDSGVILSNVFAFRWAAAAGTHAGTLLYMAVDDRAADLAEAEVAAGGGGAFIQPALAAPESRRRWKKFFAEHGDLWDGGTSWARIGVLFWNDQVFFEYPEHLQMVRRLVSIFSETQTPFDLITQEGVGTLSRYDVVVAPCLQYLDDSEMAQVLGYAEGGGRLVIIEPFGTADSYARPRGSTPLTVGRDAATSTPVDYGKGRILRLPPAAVPERRSEFWRLMEERANDFPRAREVLNEARQDELARGVDLGPEFVRRIEELLGAPLRWCPPQTPAGVYIHAYRLSSRADRPERIAVHVVNYDVSILPTKRAASKPGAWSPTRAGRPQEVRSLQITVPLPKARRVAGVETWTPTERPGQTEWSQGNDGLRLTLDRLSIYKVLSIRLE